MKPEMILQADVLDIIFDHRNKAYGAYELRRHYPGRLKRSIFILFSFLFMVILIYYRLGNGKHGIIKPPFMNIPDTMIFVSIPPDPVMLRPGRRQQPGRRLASNPSDIPVIVPDQVLPHPSPTIHEWLNYQSGKQTGAGEMTGNTDLPGPEIMGKKNVAAGTVPENTGVYEIADKMPEFPGGPEALKRFLIRNLRMPKQDLEPGISIPTLVRFVVDTNGRVNRIEFEKSGGKDFDQEVMRVLKIMPAWIPGKQHGTSVPVYFKIPVIFQVPEGND